MRSPAAFVLLLALAATAAPAAAQAPRPRPGSPPAAVDEPAPIAPSLGDLAQYAAQLDSPQPEAVIEAIDMLSALDRRESVAPLAAFLTRGQLDSATERAIEALGGIAHPDAIEVLSEFSRHRRAAVRRKAFQALAAINDARVLPILEQGLRDSDRSVRGACATALGNRSSRASLDVLFRAFERGVLEAAAAIGQVGDAASVTRFSEHLGRQPISTMLSGFEHFLRRGDLNERVKLDIVARLFETASPAVKQFMQAQLARFPARDRSALRRAIEDAARRIADAPTGSGGAR